MPIQKLPAKPSLDHLKSQARDLLKAVRQGDKSAINRVNATSSSEHKVADEREKCSAFRTADAQRVIAREYGLPSWPKLKREVERRTLTLDEKINAFVRSATHERPTRAAFLLEYEPRIIDSSLHAAVVGGRNDLLAGALEKDPSLATEKGGPSGKDWTLLHYVSHSMMGKENPEIATGLVACGKLLLQAGADPNAHYATPPWPQARIRPLFGATGLTNQPELARMLIEAGAILNDGESVYHSCEHYFLECMEILKEAGAELSKADENYGNSPLYFLIGYNSFARNFKTARKGILWLLDQNVDTNVICLKEKKETALHLAIETRKDAEIIEALLEKGADPNLERGDGATPYQLALKFGLAEQANLMKRHGARDIPLPAGDALISACFNKDEDKVLEILRSELDIISKLNEDQLKSVRLAAVNNRPKVVELLCKAGFDINYIGTQDWDATALHWSAWHGQWEAVEKLLELGADISLKANPPEDSRVLGWAIHGSANCGNDTGDYPAIVRALIEAGCEPDERQLGLGTEEIDEILLQHL